jgi:hypothetical protein
VKVAPPGGISRGGVASVFFSRMRITFTQSGGFAGLVKGCRIDTLTLAADERTQVEALVAAAGWTESWERFSEGRDRWQFEITIDRDAVCVHVVCDDSCLPPVARPLVAFLQDHAVVQKPDQKPE